MKKLIQTYLNSLSHFTNLPPLFFRLILAYGFFDPAWNKLIHFQDIVSWFSEMGLPFPFVNAVLATGTESIGIVLLVLGLGIRFITIPLIIVMLVAIATVHLGNGFSAGDNGFEIPLYYILMLFSLLITGAGKISLDEFLKSKQAAL